MRNRIRTGKVGYSIPLAIWKQEDAQNFVGYQLNGDQDSLVGYLVNEDNVKVSTENGLEILEEIKLCNDER